jgi:hypothetical protein
MLGFSLGSVALTVCRLSDPVGLFCSSIDAVSSSSDCEPPAVLLGACVGVLRETHMELLGVPTGNIRVGPKMLIMCPFPDALSCAPAKLELRVEQRRLMPHNPGGVLQMASHLKRLGEMGKVLLMFAVLRSRRCGKLKSNNNRLCIRQLQRTAIGIIAIVALCSDKGLFSKKRTDTTGTSNSCGGFIASVSETTVTDF